MSVKFTETEDWAFLGDMDPFKESWNDSIPCFSLSDPQLAGCAWLGNGILSVYSIAPKKVDSSWVFDIRPKLKSIYPLDPMKIPTPKQIGLPPHS